MVDRKICDIEPLFDAFFLDTPGAFLYISLLIPKTYTVYEIIISLKQNLYQEGKNGI
jgi:hypothetical protein